MIANHFNSKGGDQPLFGRFQPPTLSSEAQRVRQAQIVADFVSSRRAADPQARIVVLGDLNDFQFSRPVNLLKTAGLVDLVETLPDAEQYSYVFDGNSQVLDHILVSDTLLPAAQYDVVHVNSDHDPEVARLLLPLTDLAGNFEVRRSGLVLNRATGVFTGTLTLTNTSSSTFTAPLQLLFESLSSGVSLMNATGTRNGAPYITSSATLASGAQVQVPVQFSNPARSFVSYTLRVFAVQL